MKKKFMGIFALALLITVVSCSDPSLPDETNTNNSIEFQVLDIGYSPLEQGYVSEPKAVIFQDQKAWSQFWSTSTRLDLNSQTPPAPEANFEGRMIIGMTSGTRPTGGFSVSIDRIKSVESPDGENWIMHYTEKTPDGTCILTQAITTPTIFVSTEKRDISSVELKGEQIGYSCNN